MKAQSQAESEEVQRQIDMAKAQSDLEDAAQQRLIAAQEAVWKEREAQANIELTEAKKLLTFAQIEALGRKADNDDDLARHRAGLDERRQAFSEQQSAQPAE